MDDPSSMRPSVRPALTFKSFGRNFTISYTGLLLGGFQALYLGQPDRAIL